MDLSSVFDSIIVPAITEFNSGSSASRQIALEKDTQLIGSGSRIDSLDLVTLIVAIEDHAFSKINKSITIASEKAVARSSSPFKTVQSLAEYVHELINE